MSNEVIIDGCNVAECENFDDGECLNPAETVSDCEASRNCQYKQFKREIEKLKDKAYKDADMIYQLTEENREYDIDLSIEKEAHKSTIERLDKYHKALEDIREILCYGRTFYDGYFNSDKLSRTDEAIKRVNEVLND